MNEKKKEGKDVNEMKLQQNGIERERKRVRVRANFFDVSFVLVVY